MYDYITLYQVRIMYFSSSDKEVKDEFVKEFDSYWKARRYLKMHRRINPNGGGEKYFIRTRRWSRFQ